ncbi:MAG: hypothetical protein V3T08_08830 [Gemmatimonadota bacterium]
MNRKHHHDVCEPVGLRLNNYRYTVKSEFYGATPAALSIQNYVSLIIIEDRQRYEDTLLADTVLQ